MEDNRLKTVSEDLTGKTFGYWTVLKRADKDYISPKKKEHYDVWVCQCECGVTREVLGKSLKAGKSLSCGRCIQRKYNVYDLSGEYGIGYTSNTCNPFYFDLEDYDKIKDYCWCELITNNGNYHSLKAHDNENKRSVTFVKIIGMKPNTDHINRNPLDNRKCNLREATLAQNTWNRGKAKRKEYKSQFVGVSKIESHKNRPWRASITINKKLIFLGSFATEEEALIARLKAEKEYFGEFAPQKDLFEKYDID